MTPTRKEIVRLLRQVAWETRVVRTWTPHHDPSLTLYDIARRCTAAADALEAAPVLTFEEKVRQATNAARKASPAFTQRFASATADRIIRAALRAAGVQE